jgi:hypothetical protein
MQRRIEGHDKMSQDRKETYVDQRMRQLREQEAAREALVRRSPPPPPQFTAIQQREYLLKRRRLEAEGKL